MNSNMLVLTTIDSGRSFLPSKLIFVSFSFHLGIFLFLETEERGEAAGALLGLFNPTFLDGDIIHAHESGDAPLAFFFAGSLWHRNLFENT